MAEGGNRNGDLTGFDFLNYSGGQIGQLRKRRLGQTSNLPFMANVFPHGAEPLGRMELDPNAILIFFRAVAKRRAARLGNNYPMDLKYGRSTPPDFRLNVVLCSCGNDSRIVLTADIFIMSLKPLLFALALSLPLGAIAQTPVVIRPTQAIVSFTLDDAPVITSQGSSDGALGTAFNYQVIGINNPTNYSATGLPPGLSISASGLISGTPTAFGVFAVNLTVTNANGSFTTPLTLNISPWPVSSSTTNAVGVTAGALSVDSSGAAIYDLPIFAPPGVGGVEPHLALKYSSNGANGLLGVGWSLSGLSMITRGASSKELYASDTDSLPVDAVTPAIYPLFNNPTGLAVNSAGVVYVADTASNVIRTLDTSGASALFAGSPGVSGSADGVGSAARFNSPQGLALDSAGNLYVADFGNHTIRKITPAGMVTTLAGSAGLSGLVNGTGGGARFKHPTGVAVDSAGIILVADTDNH